MLWDVWSSETRPKPNPVYSVSRCTCVWKSSTVLYRNFYVVWLELRIWKTLSFHSSNTSPNFQLNIFSFSGQEGGVASRFYLCLHVFPSRLSCTSSTGNKGCGASIHHPGTWVVAPETENKNGSRRFNGDDVILKTGTNKKSFAEKSQMMIISSLYHVSYNHNND